MNEQITYELRECPFCGKQIDVTRYPGVAEPFIGLRKCICPVTADQVKRVMQALDETPRQETLF